MTPRVLSVIFLSLIILKGLASARGGGRKLFSVAAGLSPVGIPLAAAFVFGSRRMLLGMPVFLSAALLASFARTLVRPPSMAERFARLQADDLSGEEILYCRKVTIVWCGFFVFNGAVASISMAGSPALWALYNGGLSYLLMGLLFVGEYLFRWRRFPHRADLRRLLFGRRP
jgi:uncharacterized membrane protein